MIATLRRRDFGLVWLAGLISMMGDWVLYIALPIYVFRITGSALATSAMFLAEMVPALLLGSVAGVFVDRWDRKRTMVIANLVLALGLLPLLLVHSADRVWLVYVVAFVESVAAQFFTPAEQAFLPALAGEDRLTSANSLAALNNNLARLVGPALGGAIAARFGLSGVTLVDTVSFLLAALLVVLVATSGRAQSVGLAGAMHAAESAWQAVWREWVEGMALIKRERVVSVLMVMFAITAFGEGVMNVIFVVWVKTVLYGGAQELGWLMSAQAVGGVLGGLAIGSVGTRLPKERLVQLGPIIFGLIDIALFSYPLFLLGIWPGIVLIAVVGLPAAAVGASWMTLLQTSVGDEYRGRVFGALGTTQSLLRVAGLLAAGLLGSLLSPILLLDVCQGGSYVLAGLIAVVLFGRAFAARTSRPHPVLSPD